MITFKVLTLDFSKDFERLNPDTLIQKLYTLDVRGLTLSMIKSYLTTVITA